jgi:hypothetical protein
MALAPAHRRGESFPRGRAETPAVLVGLAALILSLADRGAVRVGPRATLVGEGLARRSRPKCDVHHRIAAARLGSVRRVAPLGCSCGNGSSGQRSRGATGSAARERTTAACERTGAAPVLA